MHNNIGVTSAVPTPPKGQKTMQDLIRIVQTISQSGNPDEDFEYLGGPMTGIPQFNFPRFHYVADTLRAHERNIVSPAELDDPKTAAKSNASPDGLDHDLHSGAAGGLQLIARDLIVVALPTCVGGIFIEGWHGSTGAKIETYVLSRLGKPLFEYRDDQHSFHLVPFDRDSRLAELGGEDVSSELLAVAV